MEEDPLLKGGIPLLCLNILDPEESGSHKFGPQFLTWFLFQGLMFVPSFLQYTIVLPYPDSNSSVSTYGIETCTHES